MLSLRHGEASCTRAHHSLRQTAWAPQRHPNVTVLIIDSNTWQSGLLYLELRPVPVCCISSYHYGSILYKAAAYIYTVTSNMPCILSTAYWSTYYC